VTIQSYKPGTPSAMTSRQWKDARLSATFPLPAATARHSLSKPSRRVTLAPRASTARLK
jgi:hypothetical protein